MGRGFVFLVLVSMAAVFAVTWMMTDPAAKPVSALAKEGQAFVPQSCKEAEAMGVAPMMAGQPGYDPSLDTDGDGIACPPA